MKDPAFLFYSQDFLVGTMAMPYDEIGRYIKLMCYQHQTGRMSEETVRLLVGSFSDMLKMKFTQDENGLYYNERLEEEIEKRSKFIESKHVNGKLGGRPPKKKNLINNLTETDRLFLAKAKNNLPEDEDIYSNYNIKIQDNNYNIEFVNSEFLPCFLKWIKYLLNREICYSQQIQFELFYKKLLELSEKNKEQAEKIIDQAIVKNWKDIYKLTESENELTSTNQKKSSVYIA